MTKLYITRHGQTEWNVVRRLQGHKDSELTPLGIQQAKWLGDSLKAVALDMIVSSSSGRTLKTSELIRGNRDIKIIPNDGLKEINLGPWEGMLHTDIQKQYPTEYKHFWDSPHLYQPSEGESFFELFNRVKTTMESIISEYQDKNVLVVTHAAVLKSIMVYFENKEIKDFWSGTFMKETCLNIIETDGLHSQIILQGDISHYKNVV